MKETLILWTIIGFLFRLTTAQVLTTKCPSNDWTHYKERCYLYVGYSHSWSRANQYCQKYGAKLVEPAGYVINNEIITQVSNVLPNSNSIWTGYYRPDNNQPSFVGEWSDGRATSVHVGVWGHNEPDTAAGQCAFVSTQDRKWYMGDCGSVRNFVCEMDPCPGGNRNTYMCNGKCLGSAVLCNGIDDCGNNQDEQNCKNVLGGDCTVEYEGDRGQLILPTTDSGFYHPNVNCSWTIKTSPGSRIVLQFTQIETEENNDYVEIYDGGITLSTSELSGRLSGSMSEYMFISSYNFLTVRFVSDASKEYSGFQATWDTELECSFSQIDDYTYSNVDIMYDSLELGSLQTKDKCKQVCEGDTSCVGYRYQTDQRKCYFLNKLPVLQMESGSELWIQNCHGETTVQGALPLLPTQLFASTSPQQLATPLYPYPYVGNLELEYTITASANNLITLKVLTLELCCEDKIYIDDKDHDLLDTLTSESTTRTIISTSNTVHIKMELIEHWKCHGALIEYRQGCHISLIGSGTLSSPGYGTTKSYPDLMECFWTIYAPSADRSVTVIFDNFDLEQTDALTITKSDGTETPHTGSSLHQQSITSESFVTLTMSTSSLDNAPGFMASFSPGCPVLNADGYVLSSNSFDFGDHVTVSCEEGYYFGTAYAQQTSLALSCESGGQWNMSDVPICSQGQCGHAPFIDNGNIVSSTGSLGGDVTVYECKTGFTLLGRSSIKCLANGSWEQTPNCTSTLCEAISNVAPDTEPTVLLGDGLNHGSVANLTCRKQYQIIGAPLIQCQSGYWDFILELNTSYCEPIPCETPIIENADLAPDPGYFQGQEVNVTCIEGYNLEGDPMFICGDDAPLPICIAQNCSLDEFDHVIPVGGSSQTVYMYGDNVNVTCEYNYYLDNIATTQMTVACLGTGNWSHTPLCAKKSCGEPYHVFGSEYIPAPESVDFCYEHNCSFTFRCRDRYNRYGSSSSGNTVVRCGYVYDGLWDFGDLRCIGGQCVDPGYPASGWLVGDTFQEGANLTFECVQNGYEPLNSTGHLSEGMTCTYNETSKQMEWVGEMPECLDNEAPTIRNCGNGQVTHNAKMLSPLTVAQPEAEDNTGIKLWQVYPVNTYLSRLFAEATPITYIATDFSGKETICIVNVVIPDSMDCENDRSTNIQLTGDRSLSVVDDYFDYIRVKSGSARVEFEPEVFEVTADAATLNTIHEVDVTSFEGNTSTILDKCTLQFRFHAPVCSDWAIEIPNGVKSCSGFSCSVSCNNGSHFMEEPTANAIGMACNASGWNREPPVCAQSTTSYVIFTVQYEYKYSIQAGVSDRTACESAYRSAIQQSLSNFAAAMETKCNQRSNNPVNITLLEENTFLEYSIASKRLTVRFDYQFVAQNEAAFNAESVKYQCSNTTLSSMNTKNTIDSIYNLTSFVNDSLTCNSGVYDLTSRPPELGYKCQGFRRFANITGQRLCLGCPLGYYYNQSHCLKCPSGTYGAMSADGAKCETCPNNKKTGLTGQTDASSCNFKEACPEGYFSFDGLEPCTKCPKNYYSTAPYSRTCTACPGHMVTFYTNSTSSSYCKTLEETIAYNRDVASIETGCTPDPCLNGGNCSFHRLDFLCTCPPGYTGRRCESPFNGCTSKPCKNEKECVPAADGVNFTCNCGSSFTTLQELSGVFCENDDFGCSINSCENNGTCHNQLQRHSCKCPSYSGYQNADPRGTGSGVCGIEINPCTANPCQHGTCINNSHYYRTCDCYAGWTGIDCDSNIDDCVPNYCENGATCMDGVNSFTCNCATGFHGPYCQFNAACLKKCDGPNDMFCHTCENNTESCENVNNDFKCHCHAGYAGRSCEIATTICKSYPCQHGGTCIANNAISFTCTCTEPWTGDHCDQLTNHCPNGDQCFNGGTCYSTSSGYQCRCPEDFIGDTCSIPYNLCARANPCIGTESMCLFENGQFDCNCQTGYSGDYCENRLPSCSDNVCQNGASCSDTHEGALCTCAEGYTDSLCDTDIDDCSPNPCSTNQECIDGVGEFTCTCAAGFRGEDCDKGVGEDFDYIIKPERLCRIEASVSLFGDGETDINVLSISFWVRYKAIHGDAVILSVFGSKSGGLLIPSSPDFQMTFFPDELHAFYDDTSTSRKKRELKILGYQTPVADGYWHHIVVTWSAISGELTLYVDGEYADQTLFSRNNPLANIGFLVFGAFDPVFGTSVPESSFEGRVNRLYVVNSDLTGWVDQLYSRSYIPPSVILYQERTTLRLYSVDYNSELSLNSNRCLPSDSNCKDVINAGAIVPDVISCPGDTFSVTERGEVPSWTEPVFTGSTPAISNIGGSGFEFGVHGISYASVDGEGDAAMCTFRLFYSDVDCGDVDGSDASCVTAGSGVTRCTDDCSGNLLLPGDQPTYLTCSMYGMWDQAVKYTDYIFPECSTTHDLTIRVTLNLTAVSSIDHCDSSILNHYRVEVINKFNQLNAQQPDSELCPPSNCTSILESAFSCVDNKIRVSIDFGIISPTMTYEGGSVTTEELLKITVGDFEGFHYIDQSNMTIAPDLSSFDATFTPECAAGYMVSSGKCVLCGRGTFYNSSTKSCERCAIGSYRNDLSSLVSECTFCHPSRTTPAEGAKDQSYCIAKCLPGRYYEIPNVPSQPNFPINGGTCWTCAIGYYQDEPGTITCKPCSVGLTTAGEGSTDVGQCVTPESLTTTTLATEGPLGAGAATEETGLSVGVIVAVVLGVILFLAIIILIVCFCCCKELLPCLAKKKIAPTVKDGYYARKYGDQNMQFVSYNLQDIREKKGKPIDRVPFVAPALSEESGSVKTDISVHVPVFNEKINGKIKRKSLYVSNGGHNLSHSARTPRDLVMTSSPRESQYQNEIEEDTYVKAKQKRRRRKQRKERSSSGRRSRRRHDDHDMASANIHVSGPIPKALAPMPHRLVSKPPDDVILRPSSALEQPRVQVIPSQYEDFLDQTPTRDQRHSSRSRDKDTSKSRQRPKSSDDDLEEPRYPYSGEYYDEEQPAFRIQRIEVESDEDLR